MKTINERVQLIVNKYYNGNVSVFERSCGLKNNTLKHVLGGRLSKPSFDTIEAIVRTIVQLNIQWLITGEGDIEKKQDEQEVQMLKTIISNQNDYIEKLKKENQELREQLSIKERQVG